MDAKSDAAQETKIGNKNDLDAAVMPVLDNNIGNRSFDEEQTTEMGNFRPEPITNVNEDYKKAAVVKPVGFFQLFRFSSGIDKLLICLGSLAAIAYGTVFPLVILFMGELTTSFIELGSNKTISSEGTPPDQNIISFSYYFVILGFCTVVIGFIQVWFWSLSAERQIHTIRIRFFHSVIHQDIAWFDTHKTGELANRFSDDIDQIQAGIGEKLGAILQSLTTCVGGIMLGFVKSWELTLVILAFVVFVVFPSAMISGKLIRKLTQRAQDDYSRAGAVAEEVLSSIRTVVAFSGEEKEAKRYYDNLHDAKIQGIKKDTVKGLFFGIFYFSIYSSYSFAFWYGTTLYLAQQISPGDILVTFLAVLFGFFSLGNAAQNFAEVATAKGAAATIWKIIDRRAEIDSSSKEGIKPGAMTGHISFENVHFSYPTRKDIKVLNNVNLEVNVGETVALVGVSGCGKSTIVRLIQRFYDIDAGRIKIDGNDVRDLNINSLRENIAVVSQEPVLFATSIRENIGYGKIDASMDDIVQAAKEANAHDFISALPEGYDTQVGNRGIKLSGGQKQRIAIARALVREPKILLLDEATSALDTESEVLVQDALDKAKTGRTTVVIAHRLATVKNADMIYILQKGAVVEKGKHKELMEISEGMYKKLATVNMKETKGIYQTTRPSDKQYSEDKSESSSYLKPESCSGASDKLSNPMDGEEIDADKYFSISRVMKLNTPEVFYIFVGSMAAAIAGGITPTYAYMFSLIMQTFSLSNEEEIAKRITLLCGLFLALAITALVTSVTQNAAFGKSGEELTLRLRHMAFKAILRQDIAWFDDDRNSTGVLTTRLATETSQMRGITGARIGFVIQISFSMGIAVIISFYFGWQLTLLLLGFLPLIALGGGIKLKLAAGHNIAKKQSQEKVGQLLLETVENIRTVASLTREKTIYGKFKTVLQEPYLKSQRNALIDAIAFGASQAMLSLAYAAIFRLGGHLVGEGLMEFQNIFLVFGALVFGGLGLGRIIATAPDYGKAKIASCNIFKLLDRVPPIDTYSKNGLKPEKFTPVLHFKDVHFKYPTRPKVQVLQGLTITVNPGETLGLVGSSGCGKSTTINLTKRFYDPLQGNVYLDMFDVKDLNIRWLRSQIGLVSQEPVLFDGTIAENIAYGDNSRDVLLHEIIESAKTANIHSFIKELPLGYDTNVGERGIQLSGGQKQRIAIARALIRNPKILLLDEATSSLDTESEKLVQDALDKAKKGRTCITIAHRMSTIHDAEIIAVIQHGEVKECGTHDELMELEGHYRNLYVAQELTS